MDAGVRCTCPIHQPGSPVCVFCGGLLPPAMDDFSCNWSFRHVPRLTIAAFIGALIGLFALGGALLGSIAGALAGRASERGLVRGSVLGAIAGTVLSLEILDALRAYWFLELTGLRGSSSLIDFVEELLRGRSEQLQEQFEPSILNLQVSIDTTRRYGDIYNGDAYDKFSRGLSHDSLKKLPHHVVSKETETKQSDCCSICLQNIEVGDIARSLPRCHHVFHLMCVDKWLAKRGSCPICRVNVKVQYKS